MILNGLPWRQTEIILLFLRLHPSTAIWTLLLTMLATPFLLRDSCPRSEVLVLVAPGPLLKKHHSPQTMHKGPTGAGFFMLQHPHQGFKGTNRHSPKEAQLFQVEKGGGVGA